MVVPPKHPKMIIFGRKTMVVGYHHFRKPPFRYFSIPSASPAITTLLGQDCSWAKFHVFVAKVTMESLGEGCVRMGVKKTYIYIYMWQLMM